MPPGLLPPGATLIKVERRGPGRLAATVVLAERQPANHVHQHFSAAGWRLRRVNVLPDESDQTYIRRSLRGYLFESTLVRRDEDNRRQVTLFYQRCVRRLSCGWR
ncbi:MAG: hypothetical protein HC822_19630 [Oscillochloris sp.]|nr:hypothetical protein [Oscillochloris sp.]